MSKDQDFNILPLEVKSHTYQKDRMSIFKMPIIPTDATSIKYDFVVNHCSGDEPLREILIFTTNVAKLRIGLNMQDTKHSSAFKETVLQLLHGSAKTVFDNKYKETLEKEWLLEKERIYQAYMNNGGGATNVKDVNRPTKLEKQAGLAKAATVVEPKATNACVKDGTNAIIETMAPFRALLRIKRYLRRNCRKPDNMKIRQYIANFIRINLDELPLLPPFDAVANKLSTQECIEIFQYAIPSSWSRKMQEQGFDPVLNPIELFITKAEQLEEAEQSEDVPRKSNTTAKKNDNTSQNNNSSKKAHYENNVPKDKYCSYHGKNNTHNSDTCKVLAAQRNGQSNNNGNKTWTNKSNDSTEKSKQDLAAFISKTIRKEMNSFNDHKKRKNDANRTEIKDDDEDDTDLADFDYDCLDNLSLEDFPVEDKDTNE